MLYLQLLHCTFPAVVATAAPGVPTGRGLFINVSSSTFGGI